MSIESTNKLKKEVRSLYCEMATKVAAHMGTKRYASDCFCADNTEPVGTFDHSRSVINFISEAVADRIDKEKHDKITDIMNACDVVIALEDIPGDISDNEALGRMIQYAKNALSHERRR